MFVPLATRDNNNNEGEFFYAVRAKDEQLTVGLETGVREYRI
jgi:hypothetical protein